jgi:hypothetical protein
MERRTVMKTVPGATARFAVYGYHAFYDAVLFKALCPGYKAAFKLLGVQDLKHTVDGVMGGYAVREIKKRLQKGDILLSKQFY